ncbi:MAG: class I SAM-dependent methyltransferase [Synechococcus sp.]
MPLLPRTPEPELMDEPEQVLAYAGADFSAGDQALVERIASLFPAGLGAELVDLGCGPGNITFRLADHYPQAAVLGLDGAPAMLALARQRLTLWRATNGAAAPGRLEFRELRLPCPAGGAADLAGRFSGVVSNSLLHHLHDPQVLWRSVAELAAPGAALYVKDLRRPASAEAAEALLQRHLGSAPAVLQRDFLASLHAAFRPEEVAAQLEAAGLSGLQVNPLDDRYLEVWGRLP